MIEDFVIPINKDELLESNRNGYFVKSMIPIRMIPQALNEARSDLQENGIDFILKHFDTFFSIIVHGKKVELPIILRGFTRIQKAIEMLVHDMESTFESTNELQEENRTRFLNISKMLVYVFSWFVCHIHEEICKEASDKLTNKKKKSTKSDMEEEWESTKEKALEYVYRLLHLPLHRLWQPPIVEDTFVVLLTKMCYKILEQSKEAKQKHIRQTIFEILGIAVKKYNHGISCVVKIIQMIKFHDVLATHIAIGVVHMVTECRCNGLIKEIMKEIDQSEPSEADGRNLSVFLETIATTRPDIVLPILDELMDYLASEHYTMRNSTISVLGIVVQKALTGEDLTPEQKFQRDECLNNLQDHILDCNAYTRSKVLQVWQRLSCEGAIPLARQKNLLAATTLRLEDKSASVRKQALQLLRALLQSNPYAAKLNKEDIFHSLEKEEIEYKNLLTESVSKSARGDGQRLEVWNGLLPKIRKSLKKVINRSKEDNQNKNDIETEDEEEDAENINPDEAFEHVRQLMLKEKVYEAVTLLWNSCIKLNQNAQLKTLPFEAKEEFLFILLLKTFMESEDNKDNTNEITNSESTDKSREIKKIEAQKRIVDYWRNCLEVATELEVAISMAEKLLFSTTAGDAVEACAFLGTAYQFGVNGAATAVRNALLQIFLPDQSVRNNLADVYKQIYLEDNKSTNSSRQTALMRVKALIGLLKSLQPGQSQALNQLVVTWWSNKDLGNEELQVLWEYFSMKIPDIDALDSRSALMLITMIAQVQTNIVADNLEVLIKIGLGPRAKTDLLLARDTCRSLLTINNTSVDIKKAANRYPNDHKMFKEILTLLSENFTNKEEDGYISFVTDAINAIYHLANQPDHLMQQLILCIYNREQFNNNTSTHKFFPLYIRSKLFYIIGHIAIKEMVHLDTSVYKELKRRDALRKLKKGEHPDKGNRRSRKSTSITPISARQQLRIRETSVIMEDNGEEAVEGAVDDADAELINDILENHVVTGDGLLAQFVPLVLDVCQNPNKYNNEDIQAAGTLALTKMMTVSSRLCEESLQLLITILERSPHPAIRANVLIGISDLTTRFPNLIEPWMKHIYGRLRDENLQVRSTCVRILSSLIMRDMVRVRGQISELALCITDDDTDIREEARQFFKAYSQKANALYNVVPDILSRLTDSDSDLNESDFQEIMKYILGLLQKEAHIDSIINKVCARLKLATTERKWRDFSYCLSLLPFSQKSIRYFAESLPMLKEKIHNKQFLKAVQTIIEQTKRKPNMKAAAMELEEKTKELLKSTENTENLQQNDVEAMPPPSVPKLREHGKHRRRHKNSSDEEDDGSDSDAPVKAKSASNAKTPRRTNKSSSNLDSETVITPAKTPAGSVRTKELRTRRKNLNSPADTFALPAEKRNKLNSETPPATPRRRTSARLSQSTQKR
ncbi:CAP-D2 condensin subunit isoform X2 [Halictus rubicundus]|uniref:CAP-D2 condensin subunit isoform X2 n=1 Tax=Halictus rubicundus TaxID=77578 RepID=UPI004035A628